uniref:EGF-like domain-containing protein n=1 Tax=Monodelphis domestica TaxID=13616 RepID=F6U6R7_MONDO
MSPGKSMFDKLPVSRKSPRQISYCSCSGNKAGLPSAGPWAGPPESGTIPGCTDGSHIRRPSLIPELDVTAEYICVDGLRNHLKKRSVRGGGDSDAAAFPSSQDDAASLARGHSEGLIHHEGSQGRAAPLGARRQTRTSDRRRQEGRPALRRRKRQSLREHPPTLAFQTLSPADLDAFSYFFPEDHGAAPHAALVPSWPTPSGLTEARVVAVCRQTLANSSIGTLCSGFLGEHIDGAVDMCVRDVLLKDDLSWAEAGLALLENECEKRLLEEGKYNPGSNEQFLEDILLAFRCPNLCSGHGRCMEWGCACLQGFGSYDCGVPSDAASTHVAPSPASPVAVSSLSSGVAVKAEGPPVMASSSPEPGRSLRPSPAPRTSGSLRRDVLGPGRSSASSAPPTGDPCAPPPCFQGVPCAPALDGGPRCGRCPPGYYGDGASCQALCRPSCKNGGKCVRPGVCQCLPGLGGISCEEGTVRVGPTEASSPPHLC